MKLLQYLAFFMFLTAFWGCADYMREREAAEQKQWYDKINSSVISGNKAQSFMIRKHWQSLGVDWKYAVSDSYDNIPDSFFSELHNLRVQDESVDLKTTRKSDKVFWLSKKIVVPRNWRKERVLLHVSGFNHYKKVYVNDKLVKEHTGKNRHEFIDITKHLNGKKHQRITISTTKIEFEILNRDFCKSIWLEPVPDKFISKIACIPVEGNTTFKVMVYCNNPNGTEEVNVKFFIGAKSLVSAKANIHNEIFVPVKRAEQYTSTITDSYRLEIELRNQEGEVLDCVTSFTTGINNQIVRHP